MVKTFAHSLANALWLMHMLVCVIVQTSVTICNASYTTTHGMPFTDIQQLYLTVCRSSAIKFVFGISHSLSLHLIRNLSLLTLSTLIYNFTSVHFLNFRSFSHHCLLKILIPDWRPLLWISPWMLSKGLSNSHHSRNTYVKPYISTIEVIMTPLVIHIYTNSTYLFIHLCASKHFTTWMRNYPLH